MEDTLFPVDQTQENFKTGHFITINTLVMKSVDQMMNFVEFDI